MHDDLSDLETKLDSLEKQVVGKAPPERGARTVVSDARYLAMDLVVSVVAGGGVGWLLDRWLGTKPWGIIIFLIFGVAAGFRNFYVFAGKLLHSNPETKP